MLKEEYCQGDKMEETRETSKKILDIINDLQTLENKKIEGAGGLFTGSKKPLYKNEQKKIDPVRQWIIESITSKPWY